MHSLCAAGEETMTDAPESYRWPHEARCAVSLCYDDGNPNNLDQAIPDLEAAGLRGSFYLQVGRGDVQARAEDWRTAHQQGHEIGNHTWHHNCRVDLYGGVCPGWMTKPLEEYTKDDMVTEIGRSADWIDEHIGPDPDRSFTYPCGHTAIGSPPDQEAYVEAVRTRHRFARTWVEPGGVNHPGTVDLILIDSFFFEANTFEDFRSAVSDGLEQGGWVCLGFHGIGGESHTTARDTHQRLMDHLTEQSYWVAPLRDVARYISDRRGQP